MSRNAPRKSTRNKSKTKTTAEIITKKDADKKKTGAGKTKTAEKGAIVEQPSTGEAEAALRFANSYARIQDKWVDESSRKHWPLKDIIHGGCRTITEAGIQTIKDSLADCASLKGEERKNPELLRKGIVKGHYLTCRKTNKGVVCEDGNHKLVVYRDFL